MKHSNSKLKKKRGAALLVSLWVLIVLSLIVGSFAFEMQLEARLVSYKRKKFHAELLAYSGIEYAQAILDQRHKAKQEEIEELPEDPDGFMMAALYAKRGLPTTSKLELGDGKINVEIKPADSGRNVNLLTRQEWLGIFEMANIPSTEWDTMIGCLTDWIDSSDEEQLNGAESDDPFYKERGYPVKNGMLDSVEELLLIKGWGPEILYGTTENEGGEIFGIADMLTVWGDGKSNINGAGTNDLMSHTDLQDETIHDVLSRLHGAESDLDPFTKGFTSLNGTGLDPNKFKLQSEYVKVTSTADMFGTRYRVECIMRISSRKSMVVHWNEGPVGKDGNTR